MISLQGNQKFQVKIICQLQNHAYATEGTKIERKFTRDSTSMAPNTVTPAVHIRLGFKMLQGEILLR